MISILDFRNLELYKNSLYYPMGKDTKNRDTAIFLPSQTIEQSTNMINDKYVRNKMYYPCYFLNNKYNFKLFNKNIRLKLIKEVTRLFVDMKSDKLKYKNIRKYCYTASQLTGINTYVDMSKIMKEFFDIATIKKIPPIRMVNEYNKFITSYISDFDDQTNSAYRNKILLINFDDLGIDVKDPVNYDRTSTPNIFAILFFMLRYQNEVFTKLPFKILLRTKRYTIFIDPSKCDKDSYKLLRTNMLKMKQNSDKDKILNSLNQDEIDDGIKNIEKTTIGKNSSVKITNIQKDSISDAKESVTEDDVKLDMMSKSISANIIGELKNLKGDDKVEFAFVGNEASGKSVEQVIDSKLEKDVDKTIKTLKKENKITKDSTPEQVGKEVKEELEKNEDFMSTLVLSKNNKLTNMMSPSNLARNKLLAEKQSKIDFKGKSIDTILQEAKDQEIPVKKIESNILNKDIKELKLPNFDKVYNEKMYDRDIIDILNSFKNKSVPIYILNIDKKDTSDNFNKKFTWTVSMEAADRSRHKLVFDTPKFINDSFMYLNGNSKNIYKQLFLLPISKTEPSVVQICTNYNKAFIRRLGDKLSPKTERFRKIIAKSPKIKLELGDNTVSNNVAITSLEYDELAKAYKTVSVPGIKFIFNLPLAYELLEKNNIKQSKDEKVVPIALKTVNKQLQPVYLDVEKNIVKGTKMSLIDYMVSELSQYDKDLEKNYHSENVGKKYMYNSVTIMGKSIPLIILLSYVEGITTILRKANINHEFSDTRPILKDNDRNNKGIIEFSDGYLVYDKYPYSNSLLLNGMNSFPTKNYTYSDLDDKETYLDIFDELFGVKKLANALDNFYDLLLDPKTVSVLEDLSMPTDFVGVFLYANKLLEDNEYIVQTSANTNRIRSNEIVSAILYKTLSKAYEKYRITSGNKNPQKMTIPQDQVIKNILMLNTVEDYSTLGPILESEKVRAVSFKGHSGMNLDRAYTLENRSFDKSMLGILSMSSPPTGSVGVVRQLPLDSNILSSKGYLKSAETQDDINQANMCSPAEEMIPMCTTKDDSLRIAMANNQSKHIVPCKKYDKLLVGNGTDKIFANVISDAFAFKAKEDGKVVEFDENTGLMVLKYNDGEYDFVELDSKISKNGGGGFYIGNKLKTKLKIGSKFKKGDVLASNESYFQQGDGNAVYKAGTLTKIALASGYYTYEDSSLVSETLCENMSTEVIMDDDVVLGPNSNVDFIVKVGDTVKVGDPLIIYDTSYGDEGINKMLSSMDSDISQQINELGKKKLHATHAGVIENIEVYYTVDLDELSPSLKKTINTINSKIKNKKKLISKYVKDPNLTNLIIPPTEKVDTQYGKVKSITIGEGVYIKFYIKYYDKMTIGDKIVFFTATKSVICDWVPKGKEPFSESRPDEPIGAFLSDSSMLKRMVDSIQYNLFENKLMIELKRQCKDILHGKIK